MTPYEFNLWLKSELSISKDWIASADSLASSAEVLKDYDPHLSAALSGASKAIRKLVNLVKAKAVDAAMQRREVIEEELDVTVDALFKKLGFKK